MVVFGGKYCGIWSLIQRGEEKGGYNKWSQNACFNSTFKKAGEGRIWGIYSCAFGKYGDIWGNYRGIWGKYGGIWGKVLWYWVINIKGGGGRGGIKSGVRTPVLTPHFKRRGSGVFGVYTAVLWENMVIFGTITVVFWANMVVFGGNYCGIWS